MTNKIGETYTINICADKASGPAKANLEKEIHAFIDNLTDFELFETNIDHINGGLAKNLRSINK